MEIISELMNSRIFIFLLNLYLSSRIVRQVKEYYFHTHFNVCKTLNQTMPVVGVGAHSPACGCHHKVKPTTYCEVIFLFKICSYFAYLDLYTRFL